MMAGDVVLADKTDPYDMTIRYQLPAVERSLRGERNRQRLATHASPAEAVTERGRLQGRPLFTDGRSVSSPAWNVPAGRNGTRDLPLGIMKRYPEKRPEDLMRIKQRQAPTYSCS